MENPRERKADSLPPAGPGPRDLSRRGFLTQGAVALAGASAVAAALSPLRHLESGDVPNVEEFLQKHYKEMTEEDKQRVFARIREAVEKRYAVRPNLSDPPPQARNRRPISVLA